MPLLNRRPDAAHFHCRLYGRRILELFPSFMNEHSGLRSRRGRC